MDAKAVAYFVLLFAPSFCSKEIDWKIPSEADHISSGSDDAVGASSSIGNIANIAQSNNRGSQGSIGNIANVVQSNIDSDSLGNAYNENDKYIERPCQVYDMYCIRRFLANHSKCKKVYGPVPDPMYRAQSTMYLANINLTLTSVDVLYSGLNGRIQEFYINRETDKLVLAIEFRDFTVYSRDTYYRFHRRGKEPIVNVDYLYINYKSIISTIIIPNLKNLQLENSEVFTYDNDPSPRFSLGAKAFSGGDPQVEATKKGLLDDVTTAVQEAKLTDGPFYPATFIQYNLCDFGYKVL